MSNSYSWYCASPSPTLGGGFSVENTMTVTHSLSFQFQFQFNPTLSLSDFTLKTSQHLNQRKLSIVRNEPFISCCSNSGTSITTSPPPLEEAELAAMTNAPPMKRKRRRYRKQYPGEKKGITEEMRFVAMRLRNTKGKRIESDSGDEDDDFDGNDGSISNVEEEEEGGGGGNGGEIWQPTMEGFLKYLVDSKLVFDTVERIVDQSDDVSYAYFRKTGLERSRGLSKDLDWFSQQDIVIPPPSNPGVTYVKYLEELAEKSAPLFLSHFYNIYFSHIAGGQVIAKQVSEKLLEGRKLEFYRWDGNTEELLRGVREKLNMLGEHWSRDERNKCLREATKAFRFLGQIVRLIIL
ncbi:probable inactive heme oxygenase 2, chloroplastic [Cornus florida]|uniref:probable inactive heme oxygenase 2, chloroplastic n=1 Tax=Cornus florida TaxID=4283 RepID=UPI002897322C|nr:probable inactive heme oxygenase 2, chloroplastic [Cornus florida]XP_059636618.1 probable inactive heme oxygenase 2, chloroplastic [Cornus florida]